MWNKKRERVCVSASSVDVQGDKRAWIHAKKESFIDKEALWILNGLLCLTCVSPQNYWQRPNNTWHLNLLKLLKWLEGKMKRNNKHSTQQEELWRDTCRQRQMRLSWRKCDRKKTFSQHESCSMLFWLDFAFNLIRCEKCKITCDGRCMKEVCLQRITKQIAKEEIW